MTHQERKKELVQLLYARFDSLMLSRIQASKAIGVSTATLDRWRNEAKGPKYQKRKAVGKNGAVRYPIDAVAEFILAENIETV
jgi:hypothetical protein